MKSKQPATLDWHFSDEAEDEQQWAALASTAAATAPAPQPRWQGWLARWRFEFFLIGSVAACLFWLRLVPSNTTTLPTKPTPSALPMSQSLTTTYFRFQFAPEQAPTVHRVASRIDSAYEILSDYWGMGIAPTEAKLLIVVGLPSPAGRSSPTSETLFIPAAGSTTPSEAVPATYLAHRMINWLMGRQLIKSLTTQRIQPVWQSLASGLQQHFTGPPASAAELPTAESCAWRRALPALPLDAVLDSAPASQSWWSDTPHPAADARRLRPAELLAEYLVTTYGYERLPTLLYAFRRYDTWEELSPAVFGISASELAAQWQRYLARQPNALPFACVEEHDFRLRP